MKKSILFLLMISVFTSASLNAQGGLLKKVAGSMKDELLGTNKKGSTDPEPSCACKDAEQVVGLGGKYQLDYKEMDISTMDDGSWLLKDRISGNFYIVRDDVTSGPFQPGDSRIAGFDNTDGEGSKDESLILRYKGFVSKAGEKYVINFGGKTYGPYAQINSFVMTQSKDKFAALVVENIPVTEAEGREMDKAINNARTEQEKMDLAMQYSQMMQQKIMQGGGVASMTPEFITNIPDVSYDPMTYMGYNLNSRTKYDEIVLVSYNKVADLNGKTLINIKPEHIGSSIFVSTANNKYAIYSYGSIILSDGTSYTDLFNPHLLKTGGQVYLVYSYYSPKKNAMMQCKIPF
jgi:hypothetical protein